MCNIIHLVITCSRDIKHLIHAYVTQTSRGFGSGRRALFINATFVMYSSILAYSGNCSAESHTMLAPKTMQKGLVMQQIFGVYTVIVLDGQDQNKKSADSPATSL